MLTHWATAGFDGVKDAVTNRRDMMPEEKFFFQTAGLIVHAAGRRNNAAFAAWDRLCGIMARNYDLTSAGGRSYMRKRRDLLKWMADQLQGKYSEYGHIIAARAGGGGGGLGGGAYGGGGGLGGGGGTDLNLAASLGGGDA